MKFDYNIKKNRYKMHGEANYVAVNKKAYLRGSKKKIRNYFNVFYLCIFLLSIPLFFILWHAFDTYDPFHYKVIICSMWFGIAIFLCVLTLISYIQFKRAENTDGEVTIDKKGITDKTSVTLGFEWKHIKIIAVTKNTIVVIGDSTVMIILPYQAKIIKAVEEEIKKHENIIYVNQRKNK